MGGGGWGVHGEGRRERQGVSGRIGGMYYEAAKQATECL